MEGAFLSATPLSAAQPRAGALSSSFCERRPLATKRVATEGSNGAANTQMNIFGRLMRVFRANTNQAVGKIEDPELVMKQSVQEMERDFGKVQKSYSEVTASMRRCEAEKTQTEKSVQEWQRRAEMAVNKGDEELAREALSARKNKEDEVRKLDAQLVEFRNASERMRGTIDQYKNKLEEAKNASVVYGSRAQAASAVQKINAMQSGVGEGAAAEFGRMKNKIEAMEVSADLSGQNLPADDAQLSTKFKALESDDIEDELNSMKQKMLPKGD